MWFYTYIKVLRSFANSGILVVVDWTYPDYKYAFLHMYLRSVTHIHLGIWPYMRLGVEPHIYFGVYYICISLLSNTYAKPISRYDHKPISRYDHKRISKLEEHMYPEIEQYIWKDLMTWHACLIDYIYDLSRGNCLKVCLQYKLFFIYSFK